MGPQALVRLLKVTSPATTLFVRRRETRHIVGIISLFGAVTSPPKSEMILPLCLVSRRRTKRVGTGDIPLKCPSCERALTFLKQMFCDKNASVVYMVN